MFGRKEKEQPQDAKSVAQVIAENPQKRPPTVLEILKARRAAKVRVHRQLAKEIEQLDHDVTFVELNPHNARILEFIAARFRNETTAVEGRDVTAARLANLWQE